MFLLISMLQQTLLLLLLTSTAADDASKQVVVEANAQIHAFPSKPMMMTTTPIGALRLFATTKLYDGNLGGILGADQICREAGGNNYVNAKALLVDESGCHGQPCRRAMPNPIDWPLLPNTTYYGQDGSTIIATTDAHGLLPGTLNNALDIDAPLCVNKITGLNSSWNTIMGSTCSSWTTGSQFENMSVGGCGTITSDLLEGGFLSCDYQLPLICVASIATTTTVVRTTTITTSTTTATPTYMVFVSSAQHNGNLGGIAGADKICQSEAGASAKALLVDESGCNGRPCRQAMPNPIDWPLLPHTTYYAQDGSTVIATTDAFGLLPDTLSNDLETSNCTNKLLGLNGSWNTMSGLTCSSWTNSSMFAQMAVGWCGNTTVSLLDGGTLSCQHALPLICVGKLPSATSLVEVDSKHQQDGSSYMRKQRARHLLLGTA